MFSFAAMPFSGMTRSNGNWSSASLFVDRNAGPLKQQCNGCVGGYLVNRHLTQHQRHREQSTLWRDMPVGVGLPDGRQLHQRQLRRADPSRALGRNLVDHALNRYNCIVRAEQGRHRNGRRSKATDLHLVYEQFDELRRRPFLQGLGPNSPKFSTAQENL
jgi:hypothetical protein